MKRLDEYKTWIFDCDGVLLDSNSIKTEAFYQVGLLYGKKEADALVAYHKQFGGVSRFVKFRYFFETILKRKEYEDDLSMALQRYAYLVKKMMMQCPETNNLRLFLKKLPKDSRKIVVSGGLGSEVREVFMQRQLAGYFDAIYGSPDTKVDILREEIKRALLCFPAILIGDSQYDYETTKHFGIDFIFMRRYSEFSNWKDYFEDKNVLIVYDLADIPSALPISATRE